MTEANVVTNSNPLMNNAGYEPIMPIHDAILPYAYQGVTFAIPNLGDNIETENASVAELVDLLGRGLAYVSNMRDCFCVTVPTIQFCKDVHNLYVRFNSYVDARTKSDIQPRLDLKHITPVRKVFRLYPTRYFDVKNRYARRWIELGLYGISNIAQLSSINTWTNDFDTISVREIKKPFAEIYRLMAIELFDIPRVEADKPEFRLQAKDFDTYHASDLVPVYELMEHPFTAFFTEDRMRPVYSHLTPVPEGVTTDGGTQVSPGEVQENSNRNAILQ